MARNDFHSLNAARRNRSQTSRKYAVVRVKLDGTPSRVTSQNLSLTSAATMEEANVIRLRLERLNPGKAFIVVPV
jgi:hypothetical protein